MPKKRSLLICLVGVNLLLLIALFMGSNSLSSASAQTGGRGGDLISVTAKPAGQSYDVIYLLDLPGRKLHAFYPTMGQSRQFTHAPHRDLLVDFGRD